ncbi:MAG: CPBP family intramembrane glutamic endopeptidase [Pseudomonadota bacterium]
MLFFSLDPDVISWSYLLQFVVVVPLAILALKLPAQRWYEAIDLQRVPLKTAVHWITIWLIYWLCSAFLYSHLPLQADPFLHAINGTRHWGLTLTSLLLAPILEEIIFRSCGFRLWRHTRLGLYGTLFLTSLLFMLIHARQYSEPLLGYIFLFGVLLGYAREKTGSILVPIILHALNNLLTVFLVIWLGMAN